MKAFENKIQKINSSKIELISEDLIHKLEQKYNIISFDYLGSTRRKVESNESGRVNDIDIVIRMEATKICSDLLKQIKSYLNNEYNIECKTMFGNIVSCCYPHDSIDKCAQIDLMISPNLDIFYKYIKEMRFYSNEKELKGLHRTELIRSILKVKGLSLGTKGIKKFTWNGKYNSVNELLNKLTSSKNRCRKDESINSYLLLEHDLSNCKKIKDVRKIFSPQIRLTDRYFISGNIYVFDNPIIDRIKKILFDGEYIYGYWVDIISKYFNIDKEGHIKVFFDNYDGLLQFIDYYIPERYYLPIAKEYISILERKKPDMFGMYKHILYQKNNKFVDIMKTLKPEEDYGNSNVKN